MNKINLSLKTRYIGRKCIHFESISSTNSYLSSKYEGPFVDGLAVLADYQTNSLCRNGRHWFSSRLKSLLFSILLMPKKDAEDLPSLTQVLSLAIVVAIENKLKLSLSIKWPNDIYIGDKKCAGILSTLRYEADLVREPLVILGAGLNVNETKDGFPNDIRDKSTSLFIETGGITWDRHELLSSIFSTFEHYYDKWKMEGFSSILDEISLRFYLKGKNVRVSISSSSVFYGVVIGMDERGYLLVEDSKGGDVHCIMAGDVVCL